MALSKYEWLFIAGAIAHAVGCGIAIAVALAKRKRSKEVRFANWDTATITAISAGVMAYVYMMLATAFPMVLRDDGVQVPRYRDAAWAIVLALNTFITAVVCELNWSDGIAATVVSLIGGAAMFGGNSLEYPLALAPFIGGGIVVLIGHAIIAVRMNPRKELWPRVAFVAQVFAFAVMALTQLLSWSMTEVFDRSPERFVSEIIYLVVSAASVFGVGLVCTIAMPSHSHAQ